MYLILGKRSEIIVCCLSLIILTIIDHRLAIGELIGFLLLSLMALYESNAMREKKIGSVLLTLSIVVIGMIHPVTMITIAVFGILMSVTAIDVTEQNQGS